MPRFKYVAVGADGKPAVGVLKGSTADGIADSLSRQGYEVRSVKQEGRRILQFELTPEKVGRVELGNFSRQMGAFIKAGVPILDALQVIADETGDKKLAKVIVDVMDSLRFGDSFADAMSVHTEAFPPFYISVLRSAEATGDLDVVMSQLSRYIERDTESRRKIRSALTYPSLVMCLAVVTVVIMVTFVLPRFKTFFKSFNAKLPLPTRMLISFSGFITHWYPVMIAVVVGVVVAVFVALRTESGKMAKDRFLLALPVAGDVVRFTVIERFCRILTSMIRAGVPIPDALNLASTGANNRVYARSIATARLEMLEGGGISQPIARTKLFPGSVTQMMRVGEETGSLDEQLANVAEYYERELEYKLKKLTNLFEPLMVIFVGLIVGFVAIALISAIYGIYRQVKIQ